VSDVDEPTIDLDPRSAGGATERTTPSEQSCYAGQGIAAGRVLRDRYVLKARLGAGGKGVVFRAYDRFRASLPAAQQDVALKILCAGDGCSEQALADLRMEFHCSQLLSHRNIVNVHELDCDGDVVFFTMELLDGEPLGRVLERLRPAAMHRARAWQLIRQLGAGLTHAHERSVVHGDLKPQNVFITREGELRILDFGAAHSFVAFKSQSEHGEHARTSGTPAYASCEQLEGRRADQRDDLYALACICYELLAGAHPFDSWPATLARDYRMSLARPRGLSYRQWKTLRKGLSWHRAGRSISVRSWMHRLTKEREPEHSVTPLQELARPNPAASRTAWRVPAIFGSVGVLAVAAILIQLGSPPAARTSRSPSPALEGTRTSEVAPTPPAPPDEPVAGALVAADASLPEKKDAADGVPEAKDAARAAAFEMSVEPSQVTADDHFAEVRLHRNLLQKDSSFTWWTEPATAKPGVDYLPEAVAIQNFPVGYHGARLYIRLVTQPLRSQRSYFYVAIAKLGAHQTRAAVIRRQIWLPASPGLQAKR
jgi:eukaryotic-like serine/threonine-protein kinase